MRTALLLLLPVLASGCERADKLPLGDDDDKNRRLSAAEDTGEAEAEGLLYQKVKDRLVSIPRTVRLNESIGTTDPGRSVGEGPIPMGFMTGGSSPKLAAGVPRASSVHMYGLDALLNGAEGIADTVLAEEDGTEFGAAVADMGDIFSDGIGALAVGAPGLDAVYLYELGVPTTSLAREASLAQLEGAPSSAVGSFIARGDFDGDGISDLALGAPGLGDHGGLYLVSNIDFGTTSLEDSGVQLLGTEEAPLNGIIVNLGDLDGDGTDELGVGSSSTGRFSVFQGGGAWVTAGGTADDAMTTLTGTEGDGLGSAAAAVGDVDGDGTDDVMVGAPDYSEEVEHGGAVFRVPASALLSAGTIPIADVAAQALIGTEEGAGTGAAIALGGDEDEDGTAEVVVGSPWFDEPEGTTAVGLLSHITDTESSGAIAPASTNYIGDESGARLGAQLQGNVDLDGDGVHDVAALVGGEDTIVILLSSP